MVLDGGGHFSPTVIDGVHTAATRSKPFSLLAYQQLATWSRENGFDRVAAVEKMSAKVLVLVDRSGGDGSLIR